MDTLSRAVPGLKTIGASCSQNNSYTSSRKECKKYGADKTIHDEGDDDIVSQKKSISHLVQEEGQTIVDNLSREAPGLKTIGRLCSQNTYNTFSRKSAKRTAPTSQSMMREMMLSHHRRNPYHILANKKVKYSWTLRQQQLQEKKTIGDSCSHNTSDTSFRNEREKDGAKKPVNDEGDDAITSHQKSMFLVQSHLEHEEGRKTTMDNISM